MNKVLITGASGFIGHSLVEELIKYQIEVIAVVRQNSENIKRIPISPLVKIVECDKNNIKKLETLIDKDSIDVFYDFSWEGVAGNKRADYKLQIENVEHSADALQVAKAIGCKRFVGASSISEFECRKYMPMDGTKAGLRFIYSTAKLASHYINKCLAANIGIEYINANITNTFGPHGLQSLLVHDTIFKLLNNEHASFTEAKQIYDFMYISDVARALHLVGKSGHNLCSYYIGSSKPQPLKNYLLTIKDCIDKNATLGFGEIPYDGMYLEQQDFDCSKLADHTGFAPAYEFIDGLKRTIEWMQTQQGGK